MDGFKREKVVSLELSCVKCGSTEFEYESDIPFYKVEDMYFYNEDNKTYQFKCKRCGLLDYLENLIPSYRVEERLIRK